MSSAKKILWVVVLTLSVALLMAMCLFVYMWFAKWKMDLTINATQVNEEQNILVEWDTTKVAQKITITVKYKGETKYSVTLSDTNALLKGKYVVPTFYGKQHVEVTATRGAYFTTQKTEVNVFASEYNIAPLTGTMPVTMFTLGLKDITNNYQIPTFVWFKRNLVWNYSEMPNNVYVVPVATNVDMNSSTEIDRNIIFNKTNEWIKELYEINPTSKFNLFYNDFLSYGWLQATLANEVPTQNCNIKLLSDGVASFTYFNDHFNNDNAEQEYAKMKADYETTKQEIVERKTYSESDEGFTISAWDAKEYAYVMATEEENVEWWLTRISGTMANDNADMYAKLSSNASVKVKDLNTLFKALNQSEQEQLTELFNFSDNMFEEAISQDKEVMIILGTWHDDEVGFSNYVKAVQAYYGSSYVYYYKGHPRTPTSNIEGKYEVLDELNLIDVDSTIPAELLFFFNPEMFACGYQSTTFVSLSDEKTTAMFNIFKDEFTQSYKDNLDVFITQVSSSHETYGSYVTGNNCCVLEFNDTSVYEFAIFNADTNKIEYYKNVNGNIVKA